MCGIIELTLCDTMAGPLSEGDSYRCDMTTMTNEISDCI